MRKIHELGSDDRAKYIGEVLYARMESEGRPKDTGASLGRIGMEISESGWKDVSVEAVQEEIRTISGYMRDLGPESYIKAVRRDLGRDFGIKFPEQKGAPN